MVVLGYLSLLEEPGPFPGLRRRARAPCLIPLQDAA